MSKSRMMIVGSAVLVILAVGGVWLYERQDHTPDKVLTMYVDRGIDEESQAIFDQRIQEKLQAFKDGGESDITQMLELGNLYYQIGDLGSAVPYYEMVLENYPDDVPALENLGVALKEMGDTERAEEVWTHAVSLGAQESIYFHLSDLINEDPNRGEEARQVLEDGVATLGQTQGFMVALGNWYREREMYEEAASHYEVAVRLAPENTSIQKTLQKIRDEWKASLKQ